MWAYLESTFEISDVKEPVANEKETTPKSIVTIDNSRSFVSVAEMSPYPTVVIVVTVKYTAIMYKSV